MYCIYLSTHRNTKWDKKTFSVPICLENAKEWRNLKGYKFSISKCYRHYMKTYYSNVTFNNNTFSFRNLIFFLKKTVFAILYDYKSETKNPIFQTSKPIGNYFIEIKNLKYPVRESMVKLLKSKQLKQVYNIASFSNCILVQKPCFFH